MRARKIGRLFLCMIIAGILVLSWGPFSFSASYPLSVPHLTETINGLIKARNSIVSRYQAANPNTAKDGSEQEEVHMFISYLDGRIYYYCEQLFHLGGTEALRQTECPISSGGSLATSEYSSAPPAPERTAQEKFAGLEDEFSKSLGEFDDMLLAEQQKVASHAPRTYEDRDGSSRDQFETASGYGNGSKNSGDSRTTGDSSKQAPTTEQSGAKQSPASSDVENGSTRGAGVGSTQPSTLPPTAGNKDLSKTDDDIIARQLREAAEQETDPEVKARLWEEYKKYKEGIR